MIIELFTLENSVIIPTIHCHTLDTLKKVKEEFPDDYMKIYLYIYYMTCPDPKVNPFFNLPEDEKEEVILGEIKIDISLDEPTIQEAIKFCAKLYETPTMRMYRGMKAGIEKMGRFFETQALSTGRDGSLSAMVQAMVKFNDLRESFKGIEKDYFDEISRTRGGGFTAYDQR